MLKKKKFLVIFRTAETKYRTAKVKEGKVHCKSQFVGDFVYMWLGQRQSDMIEGKQFITGKKQKAVRQQVPK